MIFNGELFKFIVGRLSNAQSSSDTSTDYQL